MIASRREFPWCSRQLLPVLMGFSGRHAMHDLVDELEGAINARQDELDARRAFTVSAGHA
jgi:hypothetical protein